MINKKFINKFISALFALIISLLLLLLSFTLLSCKSKIKLEVNEYGGIYPKENPSHQNDYKSIYDVLGDSGCYLFKEYNDFNDFLFFYI